MAPGRMVNEEYYGPKELKIQPKNQIIQKPKKLWYYKIAVDVGGYDTWYHISRIAVRGVYWEYPDFVQNCDML